MRVFMESSFSRLSMTDKRNQEQQLFKAIRERNVDAVRKLLEANADPNAVDLAAGFRSKLTPGPLLLLARGGDDGTPSGPAALAIATCLLDFKADVHARDNAGCTALMTAAYNGDVALIKLLAARNASVEHTSRLGRTPLMEAVRPSRLHVDVTAAVRALLELNASSPATINARDITGFSALALATVRNPPDRKLIRLLLEANANANAAAVVGGASGGGLPQVLDKEKLRMVCVEQRVVVRALLDQLLRRVVDADADADVPAEKDSGGDTDVNVAVGVIVSAGASGGGGQGS